MSICEHLEVCAFYNNRISGIPNEGAFIRQLYCKNKSERCARLKMSGQRDVSDISNDINPLGVDYSDGAMS